MGLDMYLNARRYMSGFFDKSDIDRQQKIQELFPELAGLKNNFDESPVKGVNVEIGYWRKANAIHKWFVENVQDGKDDCRDYYVSREKLEELKAKCETILKDTSQAGKILPTTSGFFFGGTDYNEWYFQDIEKTVEIIDNCLALPNTWDFEYASSW